MTEPRLSPYSSAPTARFSLIGCRSVLRFYRQLSGLLVAVLVLAFSSPAPAFATPLPQDATTDRPAVSQERAAEFATPDPQKIWAFPRDHGAHPEFQTEWWYFTGHLSEVGAASGEKSIFSSGPDFGFQLTFFRRALFERPLVNRSSEGVLAHAALSYLKGGTFLFDKRYQRQGIGSESGLSSEHLDVSLGDWSVVGVEGASDKFLLKYALAGRRIELTATVTTPVMFQGENGFSRKGNCATCASHYYSLPRLALSGTIIESDGSSKMVTGLGWMDHEFMSNALQPEQTGWDWVSLMTKDGESIMYFQLRADSPSARFVACKRMMPDYSTKDCKARLKVESTWRSARSGAKYPAKFTLVVDEREFSLATLIEDQELSDDQMSYYEGAIGTEDRSALGYFELTGYDKPLSRRF